MASSASFALPISPDNAVGPAVGASVADVIDKEMFQAQVVVYGCA
jgi:hypothetical protein